MNKPDIRFNGFDGEWEEKNYKEVFDTSVSNNTFSRAELTSEKTSTKNVHYGDILIKYNSILSVKKDDFPFIPDNVKVDSKNFLKNGDIVFADTAEDETCGKAVEITDLENENVLAGLHTFVARPKLQFQEKYLGYFINSPAYHNKLVPYMQGTKVTSISKTNVQKTSVKYPNKAEQTKIGELFSKIDTLITSTQKEHDKLLALKKSMLQKMFPKQGSQVPEIRFKGFTDEWVEKKLGKVTERITRKNSNLESNIPLTISAQYGLIDQRKFFNKRIASKDVSGYYVIYNGEFAYNKSYSDGYPFGAVKRLDNYEKGVLSTLYIIFALDKSIDSTFLSYFYETTLWHKDVSEVAAEGARNHGLLNITADDFFKTMFIVPKSISEQQKIGTYFQNLDNLISSQAKKIEKLKTIKNTLLGKMFV